MHCNLIYSIIWEGTKSSQFILQVNGSLFTSIDRGGTLIRHRESNMCAQLWLIWCNALDRGWAAIDQYHHIVEVVKPGERQGCQNVTRRLRCCVNYLTLWHTTCPVSVGPGHYWVDILGISPCKGDSLESAGFTDSTGVWHVGERNGECWRDEYSIGDNESLRAGE